MENFNTVPNKGTFGGSVEVINQNFSLAQQEMEVLENLISPDTKHVTVVATQQTTSVTHVLPKTGSTDTIYRVGSWDGIQYNDSVFSEYAWNGNAYIKLSTKSQEGEVYDISANHSGAKYADLTSALGTGGANIPEGLRKGGMSVKFVQSSDNKYVRYNLLASSFTTDTTQWAVDDVGVYVENPEFTEVHVNLNGRIYYGVKKDGDFYFGAGIPSQIKEKFNEIISSLNNKVNVEQGKSLIDSEVASGLYYVENPEYADVTIDSKGRMTEALTKKGEKVFFGGIKGLPEEVDKIINERYSSLRGFGNVLYGKKWVSCGDSLTQGDFTGLLKKDYLFQDEPYKLCNKVYPYFIGRRNNMNIVNEALSGSTMALDKTYVADPEHVDINTRNPFSYQRYLSPEFEDADYITLWFGSNDAEHTNLGTIDDATNETFYGAWNVVMEYFITHYTTAKIGIIVTYRSDSEQYKQAVRDIALKWGIPYLDMTKNPNITPIFERDLSLGYSSVAQNIRKDVFTVSESNTHPNAKAHEFESYFIESWLRNL